MTISLTAVVLLTTAVLMFSVELAAGYTFSLRLIHGLSNEAVSFWASKGKSMTWPKRESVEHMRLLLSNDWKRQRLKLGSQKQLLFPSEGSETNFYGNDLSWLHYVWIDIGTPNALFLVALDASSDLLWLLCNCVQCAPLSSSYYSMLDKDLNEYNPARSSSSKHLSCSHQLCELGPNCRSPKNTDQLHLTSVGGHEHQGSVLAPIVIGCGSKQSGNYLSGAAPDGVMGLGPGEISVPSLLAKSGFVPHSFSLCFGKSNSGIIFFGDKGLENERRSSFVYLDGNYYVSPLFFCAINTYVVEVQHYCVGGTCPKQSGFQALVEGGSSFTLLPSEIFTKVVTEIILHMLFLCSSQGLLNIPSMKLLLAANQSFVIQNPMFTIFSGQLFTKKLLVEMLEAYHLRRTRVTTRKDPKFAMSDGEQIGHGANWCHDT
ncbi:hypothetical protein R3W88_012603 [Solanum pinnatisectum]|uniref:Peptidase A1 domain-containing protein n=1 Tax=Solanum pinnatisectum TaxID=50273 RepID=A0AAV9LC50_9SOLN|nr:hypothetical protein R3W88_012603 [Solanum pinnatisectum]